MNIQQLRYFISVLEAKTLHRASTVLKVTQPALSIQIQSLEQELGVKLLHRSARGIVPTDAGVWFGRRAGELIRKFDLLRQGFHDYAAGSSNSVLFKVARGLPRDISPTITRRFREFLPDVQLKVIVGDLKQINHGSQGTAPIDLVLTFSRPDDDNSVSEPLIKEELLLVYSAEQRRLPRKVPFRKLSERTLILPGQPHYVRRLVETAAQFADSQLKIFDVDSIHTTIELVKRGVGDTLLPLAWTKELNDPTLGTASISDLKLQRTLYMVHSPRQIRSPAIDLIRRETRSVIFELANDRGFGWKKIV